MNHVSEVCLTTLSAQWYAKYTQHVRKAEHKKKCIEKMQIKHILYLCLKVIKTVLVTYLINVYIL